MIEIKNPSLTLAKLNCFKCKKKIVQILSPTQRFHAVVRNHRPHIDCRHCGALNPIELPKEETQNSDSSI